jgi:hypothetical protein
MKPPEKKKMNPLLVSVMKTPEAEIEQGLVIQEETESLTAQMQVLQGLRQQVMVQSKRKDLEVISKTEQLQDIILDSLIKCAGHLESSIEKMVKKANAKELRELTMMLKLINEIRADALGFDETRGGGKKKMKLQVAFKNSDGSQVGVSLEQ